MELELGKADRTVQLKRYTGCEFEVDLRIKPVSKITVQRNKYRAEYPCFIVIKGTHNHSLESAMGLRQLRVLPETREELFKYFEMAFTRSQATRIHQEKLNFNLTDLANHGINPSLRLSAWIREVWLTENHGQLSGESMFSAIKKYAEISEATRIELEVHDGATFAIILVTDLMMRCHQELKASSEVVFVDTTSHEDQLNTAVTPLLCAGPVGAVPLGIIFSSSQDEIGYKRGFQLLKKVLKSSVEFDNYWLQFCKSSVSQQNDKYTTYLTKLVEEEWSIHY
ncbi:hypothetical protein Pcinc_004689 [Petrolisthes cinctipes]|uniref:MULE transposase domain-containing protein n=1 Tax=Petrolisthes cinctipes TaxID=88211 RepID=A0AAE1GET8_PETCI|nr:hypothetical protein Pcinc_004689 [Petrolisthes cinctipes]